MPFQDDIEIYLRSRFTVIWIASYEEDRIITTLKTLCERTNPQRRLFTWDIAAYFKAATSTDGATLPDARDPKTALEAIAKTDGERDASGSHFGFGQAGRGAVGAMTKPPRSGVP